MPYEIRDGNCVYKKGASKPMKCFSNRRRAAAYLRALEMNVEDAKIYSPVTQDECQYTELTTTTGQACANCRFFKTWEGNCALVENYPMSIMVTGWCNKWEAPPTSETDMEEPSEMETEDMMGEHTAQKSLIRRFVDWFLGTKAPAALVDSGFKVLDNNRFKVWWTNNYEDNEGEIFPAAELDTFIGKVQAGEYPYPVLQFAHLSGTDHGKTDGLWRIGNFALAAGTFDDTPNAERWKTYHIALQQSGQKIGVSHRYWFNEKQMDGKVYGPFQTFEISWFPIVGGVKPANPLTSMEFKTMTTIPTELRESMKQQGGFTDAEIDEIIAQAKQLDERAIAERRAAKTEGGEDTSVTEDTTPIAPAVETKPEPEKPVAPEVPIVKPEDVQKAVADAVRATEAKWQQAQKASDQKLDTLTQAVTDLTKRLDDALTVRKPASKSIWTLAADDDADVMDMKAAEADAKKGKKRSIVEMMAGENHSDEM